MMRGGGWKVMALTSLSWLLPVELSADGRGVVAVHYDRAIAPRAPYQCYGVEDARISKVGDRYLMTTCSVSPERHSTTLYTSADAIDWELEGIVLDHQNKDMLIFEGLIDNQYWAQTRPLGDLYFAYPPGSEWRAGPAINLATSPDALHWKPYDKPGIRPHSATMATARMGGGAPPILTDHGWLSLWHGVEPLGVVGIYRTYWSLLDRDDPSRILRTSHDALIEPNPALTEPLKKLMYLDNVVFTTGIADASRSLCRSQRRGGTSPAGFRMCRRRWFCLRGRDTDRNPPTVASPASAGEGEKGVSGAVADLLRGPPSRPAPSR